MKETVVHVVYYIYWIFEMKAHINTLLIALAVVIAASYLADAVLKRNEADNSLFVTGLGSKDFVSDLIIWQSDISARNPDLKAAYASLAQSKNAVKDYLTKKGVQQKEIELTSIDIEKEFNNIYNENGNVIGSTFVGYKLTQSIRVESKQVDLVERISREVSELINSGIEITTNPPLYYYTKLAELKLEMIETATEDARKRAEKIADNADSELGKLKNASMGVFQIIGQNSDEEYESGGSFNTSKKNKTATITVRLEYATE